jgi:hypothetical protein
MMDEETWAIVIGEAPRRSRTRQTSARSFKGGRAVMTKAKVITNATSWNCNATRATGQHPRVLEAVS